MKHTEDQGQKVKKNNSKKGIKVARKEQRRLEAAARQEKNVALAQKRLDEFKAKTKPTPNDRLEAVLAKDLEQTKRVLWQIIGKKPLVAPWM